MGVVSGVARARDHVEQLVAVDGVPRPVDHQAAVAVAVQRDARVGLALEHLGTQRLEVRAGLLRRLELALGKLRRRGMPDDRLC